MTKLGIRVEFDEDDVGAVLNSFKCWDKLLPYLERAFDVKVNEKITSITVDKHGIRAKFRKLK